MEHFSATPNIWWKLKPTRNLDVKDNSFKLSLTGWSYSYFAKFPTTRKIVSGYSKFLEGSPVTVKISIQTFISFSVTDSDTVVAVQCAQDIMYVKIVLEGMKLTV